MAISTCTEYEKQSARLSREGIAESKSIRVALADCYVQLDQRFANKDVRFRADRITKVPEPSDGFTEDEKDLRRQAKECEDTAAAAGKVVNDKYTQLFSKLSQEAFDKRIRLAALAIYSTDQSGAAANWMDGRGGDLVAGIEVQDIEALRAELETDRCVNEFALFAQFDNGAIGVQIGQEDLAQFVSSISQTKTKVSDYVYVDGPLQGDPPAAALEDLKELLGAGQLILGWMGSPEPKNPYVICWQGIVLSQARSSMAQRNELPE